MLGSGETLGDPLDAVDQAGTPLSETHRMIDDYLAGHQDTTLGGTRPAFAKTADVQPETGPATVNAAVDTILQHPNPAQFLIRKLWAEFIASPIPQATLDGLIASRERLHRLLARARTPG